MKKIISTITLAFLGIAAFAQRENHVSWTTKSEKIGAGTYKIIITATVDNPWHVYSQHTPDGGPVPTTFTFSKNPLITLVGKTEEKGDLKTIHDKGFGVDVKYYSDKVDFIQIVKVRGNVKTNVSGSVNFETCNDHECLPPVDYAFSVKL